MTAKIRIMAESSEEAAEIRAAICSVLEVADNGREYPNRNGFGVRRYLEARVPQGRTVRADATRVDRPELEGDQ